MAIIRLDIKIVVKLITRQVDVNQRDLQTGDSPIHTLVNNFMKNMLAARKILEFLANAGADLNVKNYEGWTPMHLAVRKGSLDIVEALLSLRGLTLTQEQLDLNVQGGSQLMTPLHLACCSNLYRIVYLLIAGDSDLFLHNLEGKSSLTVINNNLLMMKIVKKGMTCFVRDAFEDSQKKPKEHHLTSNYLLQRLTQKYILGSGGKT